MGKSKKNKNDLPYGERPDTSVVSSTEMTGLTQTLPTNAAAENSYADIANIPNTKKSRKK
ncbi:MAG: hypothetical protein RR147_01615 [Oscillospiraceae bacterium]